MSDLAWQAAPDRCSQRRYHTLPFGSPTLLNRFNALTVSLITHALLVSIQCFEPEKNGLLVSSKRAP
ncbi:hypothetical protein D3C77_232000 [compost metagenome]